MARADLLQAVAQLGEQHHQLLIADILPLPRIGHFGLGLVVLPYAKIKPLSAFKYKPFL